MTARIIDGKAVAAELRASLTSRLAGLPFRPRLIVILVGDDPASAVYVRNKDRAAAEAGTLSGMVGGEASVFEKVRPLIAHFANEITLCGPVGCGQVVKILNNMILFEIGVAIAEAKAISTHAGVDPALLFDTLSKGSGDSFALRNHGMKAMIPDQFPLRAFSVQYARKDLGYALRLASEAKVDAQGARNADAWFDKAIKAGLGEQYWPVISRLIGK